MKLVFSLLASHRAKTGIHFSAVFEQCSPRPARPPLTLKVAKEQRRHVSFSSTLPRALLIFKLMWEQWKGWDLNKCPHLALTLESKRRSTVNNKTFRRALFTLLSVCLRKCIKWPFSNLVLFSTRCFALEWVKKDVPVEGMASHLTRG